MFSFIESALRPPRRVQVHVGEWGLSASLIHPGELTYAQTVRLLHEQPEDHDHCLCLDRGWGDGGQPIHWFIAWAGKDAECLDFRNQLCRVSLAAKNLLLLSGIADGIDTYGGYKARCIIDMRRPTAEDVASAEAVEAGFLAAVRWCAQARAYDENEERLLRNRKAAARRRARRHSKSMERRAMYEATA